MTLFDRLNENTKELLLEAVNDKGASHAIIELKRKTDVLELTLRTCHKIAVYSNPNIDEHFMTKLSNQFKTL